MYGTGAAPVSGRGRFDHPLRHIVHRFPRNDLGDDAFVSVIVGCSCRDAPPWKKAPPVPLGNLPSHQTIWNARLPSVRRSPRLRRGFRFWSNTEDISAVVAEVARALRYSR